MLYISCCNLDCYRHSKQLSTQKFAETACICKRLRRKSPPTVSGVSALLPTPDHSPAGRSMQGQARPAATVLQQLGVQRLPHVTSPAPALYAEGSRAARSRLQAAAGPDSSSGVQAKASASRVQDTATSWSVPAQNGGQPTAWLNRRNNGISSNNPASEQAPGSGILGQVDVCIVQTLPAVVSNAISGLHLLARVSFSLPRWQG